MEEGRKIFERFYEDINSLHLHFEYLDSPQQYCIRNMKKFIEDNKLRDDNMIIVSCDKQYHGIGTRDTYKNEDRIWLSEEGNVFVTFLFLWNDNLIDKVKLLTQTCTVAISKTLESFYLVTQIKWINDVYVNYKKISGCLIHMYDHMENQKDHNIMNNNNNNKKKICLLVGIGINVNLEDQHNILNNNYTSIKKEYLQDFDTPKLIPTVEQITLKLIINVKHAINTLCKEGFTEFLNYIISRLLYKDKKVIINQDNQYIVGYLKGLLHDGSLLLFTEDNKFINVHAGRLHVKDDD
ncbi:biotin-acetyl-CoA-carboxylase ligase [Plasmodium falciparum RAJ116]|uniref:Biotin-acetyl-CoA-carboxylase ligase n=1 Tax=Plasmodium falciparum RAJ116 TaxID=580058 RepID=A0A0L0CVM1_PLAFA|nr:biotin-acetyl-CoA-carboxylase ligase [Plasmodium falciparum RAJ116]